MGSRKRRNAEEIAAYIYELEKASVRYRDKEGSDAEPGGQDGLGDCPEKQRMHKSGLFSGG